MLWTPHPTANAPPPHGLQGRIPTSFTAREVGRTTEMQSRVVRSLGSEHCSLPPRKVAQLWTVPLISEAEVITGHGVQPPGRQTVRGRPGRSCLGAGLPWPPTSARKPHPESPGKDSGVEDSSVLASGTLGRDRAGLAVGMDVEPARPRWEVAGASGGPVGGGRWQHTQSWRGE